MVREIYTDSRVVNSQIPKQSIPVWVTRLSGYFGGVSEPLLAASKCSLSRPHDTLVKCISGLQCTQANEYSAHLLQSYPGHHIYN